jgi:hypothetical protein
MGPPNGPKLTPPRRRPKRRRRRPCPHERRTSTLPAWCTATSSPPTSSFASATAASSSSTWALRATCAPASTTVPPRPSWTPATARPRRWVLPWPEHVLRACVGVLRMWARPASALHLWAWAAGGMMVRHAPACPPVRLPYRITRPGAACHCPHRLPACCLSVLAVVLTGVSAACNSPSPQTMDCMPTACVPPLPCLQYVLPTDAPHLSRQAAPVALAMSPLLWNQHRPDCFDTYSAGVILMQLAVPSLRTVTALRTFRQSLARNGHDIEVCGGWAGPGPEKCSWVDAWRSLQGSAHSAGRASGGSASGVLSGQHWQWDPQEIRRENRVRGGALWAGVGRLNLVEADGCQAGAKLPAAARHPGAVAPQGCV